MAAVSATKFPTTPLVPPADIVQRMEQALQVAATDAAAFARTHTPDERWLIPHHALLKLGFPPKPEEEKKELQYLHTIAAARTPEQTATAQWYSAHGLTEAWDLYLAEYTQLVGPAQAKAAVKLLHDTLDMVNSITQTAKSSSLRKRPFDVDPTLPLAVDRPGNNPSYPSGHTSNAVAAAVVLSHLMPHRKAEFMNIMMQASFARIYAGVHFPSDVVAGAKLGATIASYMASLPANRGLPIVASTLRRSAAA